MKRPSLSETLDRVPPPDLVAALARRKVQRPEQITDLLAKICDHYHVSPERVLDGTVHRDLTRPRHQFYRALAADGSSAQEIAHVTGHSLDNVRVVLSKTRQS